jgi:hypothetical protein
MSEGIQKRTGFGGRRPRVSDTVMVEQSPTRGLIAMTD